MGKNQSSIKNIVFFFTVFCFVFLAPLQRTSDCGVNFPKQNLIFGLKTK